jgi:hypothetical protein
MKLHQAPGRAEGGALGPEMALFHRGRYFGWHGSYWGIIRCPHGWSTTGEFAPQAVFPRGQVFNTATTLAARLA